MSHEPVEVPVATLAYSNTVTLQAVVQLLSEKGILGWQEVLNRVEKLECPERPPSA